MSVKNSQSSISKIQSKHIIIALVALIAVSLAYTVLLSQYVLPLLAVWTSIILTGVFLYLFWRLVLAVEKIATTTE